MPRENEKSREALGLEIELERFNRAALAQEISPEIIQFMANRIEELGAKHFSRLLEPIFIPPLQGVELVPITLSDFLDSKLVQGDLSALSWPPVVSEAVRLLKRKERNLDLTRPFRELLDQGMNPGWFPGAGIGLPHVTVPGISTSILVVIRLRTPLPLAGAGAEPVRLLFFLFEPEENEERHLQLLARISRLLSSAANRGLLHATADTWALYQTLKALDESF